MQLTDAMNEAKDTHRYLKRLDEAWELLYQDLSISQMQQLLPGLLSSIRTMQTVCRCASFLLSFLSLQCCAACLCQLASRMWSGPSQQPHRFFYTCVWDSWNCTASVCHVVCVHVHACLLVACISI